MQKELVTPQKRADTVGCQLRSKPKVTNFLLTVGQKTALELEESFTEGVSRENV